MPTKNLLTLALIFMPALGVAGMQPGTPIVHNAESSWLARTQQQKTINQSNESVFLAAAEKGEDGTVRAKLAGGVNVNSTDNLGNTALIFAANNSHLEIVELLLSSGINVNSANNSGITALMFAANNSKLKMVELLIAAGADVNLADKAGFTALMNAADQGKLEIVEALVKAGADVNVKTKASRYTALHMALRHMCDNERPCKRIKALIKKLISKGADVNAETEEGATPLMIAAALGNIGDVKVLLSSGADVNKVDLYGETALCLAINEKNAEVVELLDPITVRPCPIEPTKQSTTVPTFFRSSGLDC